MKWSRSCLSYERVKVNRHIRTRIGRFETAISSARLHLNSVGPLPPSRGFQYLLTMVDRETNWPEAVPTNRITAETVAKILIETWVARFGAPA